MVFRALALSFLVLVGFHHSILAQTTLASCPESAKFYAKDSINIITFGASTVQGVNGLDFQSQLKTNFVNCYVGKTINVDKFAIAGETTGQGLLRIDDAIAGKTGFIFILIGVNDAFQINLGKQTIKNTEANMRQLIVRALNQNLVPIIGTLQNVDDRNDATLRRINAHIRAINTLYRALVIEYKIYLADINAAMLRDFSLYQDFVHPNARGNRLISFVIFDTINKIIAERFLKFVLTQNYPNPAKDFTSIDLVLPVADFVELKLYNIQGKPMRTILNEYLNTGKHTVQLDLSRYPPGVYIYRLFVKSSLRVVSKKLIISD